MAPRSPSPSHPDSFGARSVLAVEGRQYEIFSLKAPSLVAGHEVDRLPYSIKVILENLLRHEDSPHVSPDDIVAVAAWGANPEAHGQGAGDAAHEIALTPERVLMQDFTGVPGVVDLAAMRDALARLGGNASLVNPLVPVELVIDHSVIVERSGDASSYDQNVSIEYERNIERYQLLRWAQGPIRTPPWSTAWAFWAGASAASRPRQPCWGNPSPCCSLPWWACAFRGSCGPAPPRPMSSSP
jgi:aconitate hydratase